MSHVKDIERNNTRGGMGGRHAAILKERSVVPTEIHPWASLGIPNSCFAIAEQVVNELACVAGVGGCTELSASPPSQESLRRLPWCTCVSASE